MNLIQLMNISGPITNSGGILFIIGTLVIFLSPLGALLQIAGISLVFYAIREALEGRIPSSIGPYLGIASAIILIVSMIKPLGLNYGSRPIGLKGRFLTFSKAPEPLPPPDQTPQKPSMSEADEFKMVMHCSQCGKPTDGGAFCKHCGAKLS